MMVDIGEVGEGTISTESSNWMSVQFQTDYPAPPVVIAKPLSYNGKQPAHARVRDVTTDGFKIKIEEWWYQDSGHMDERFAYLALSPGEFTLAGTSMHVEVGTFRVDHNSKEKRFGTPFEQLPVVLTQPQTFNGEQPVVTRLTEKGTHRFSVRLQEEERRDGYHKPESVGYIAIDSNADTMSKSGAQIDARSMPDRYTDEWQWVKFRDSFDTTPVILTDLQTYDGRNTAQLRYRNAHPTGFAVSVEEDQSRDEETWHTDERVGYLAIEDSTLLYV